MQSAGLWQNIFLIPALGHPGLLLSPMSVLVSGVCGASACVPGASANRSSFRMFVWEHRHISLGPELIEKRVPSKLQSDFKVIQVALGGHLKTCAVYGVVATLCHLWKGWELILLLPIFQAPTSLAF